MVQEAGGCGHWWAFMWVGMIGLWTLVIAVIWVMFASLRDRPDGASGEEALARRFASGEIDRDEYRARLSALRAGRSNAREVPRDQ